MRIFMLNDEISKKEREKMKRLMYKYAKIIDSSVNDDLCVIFLNRVSPKILESKGLYINRFSRSCIKNDRTFKNFFPNEKIEKILKGINPLSKLILIYICHPSKLPMVVTTKNDFSINVDEICDLYISFFIHEFYHYYQDKSTNNRRNGEISCEKNTLKFMNEHYKKNVMINERRKKLTKKDSKYLEQKLISAKRELMKEFGDVLDIKD